MKLFLIRHGETEHNVAGLLFELNHSISQDIHLTRTVPE